MKATASFISAEDINKLLESTRNTSPEVVQSIIGKARQKKGLTVEEVGQLVNLQDKFLLKELFETAALIKQEIYGERLVFFAPLYVSDYCVNDCAYCSFHARNKGFIRRKLTLDEVGEQTKFIINQGHKRILLEFGEDQIHNKITVQGVIHAKQLKNINSR